MKSGKFKGVLIHPCLRKYRVEFLNEINSLTELDLIENSYPSSGTFVTLDRGRSIKDSKFKIVKQTNKNFLFFRNSDTSIFSSLGNQYNFIVFSSFISFPFILLIVPAVILRKKIYVFDELWVYPKTKKFKLLKPVFKFIVNTFVDGFILSGTKANYFNESFFSDKIKRKICFNIHEKNNSFGIEKSNFRRNEVLYLGRVVKIKGLDKLINALKSTNYNLTVFGDGDFLPHCQELARKYSLQKRIKFNGSCERHEVDNIFRQHRIFCLPSQFIGGQSQQVESWGFTVNEALSNGCLVLVSSLVGAAHDLIIPGFNGYIFDANNERDFVNKLEMMREIDTTPSEIVNDLNSRFSNEVNARNFFDLIKS